MLDCKNGLTAKHKMLSPLPTKRVFSPSNGNRIVFTLHALSWMFTVIRKTTYILEGYTGPHFGGLHSSSAAWHCPPLVRVINLQMQWSLKPEVSARFVQHTHCMHLTPPFSPCRGSYLMVATTKTSCQCNTSNFS